MTISEFRDTKQFISVMVFFYVFMALYNIYNVTLKTTDTAPEETETPEIVTTYKKIMSWKGITAALVIMYLTIATMNVYKTVKK